MNRAPWKRVRDYFDRRAKVVGIGRTRIVYLYPGRESELVIKVPLNDVGNMNNEYERDTWQKMTGASCSQSAYFSALARKLSNLEICILVMERISPVTLDELTPDERLLYYCTDCGQVGRNRSGNVVVYDWGPG